MFNFFSKDRLNLFTWIMVVNYQAQNVFATSSISHFQTPRHSPEHNGTLEHCNHHIVEMGLTSLMQVSLSLCSWSFAFQTIFCLINHLTMPILFMVSPFEKLLRNYTYTF